MAQDKCSYEVKTIVTDNTNVREKSRQLLITESDLDLLAYRCSSHWLNLPGQDITLHDILKQVIKVQKYFSNHNLSATWLKKYTESVKT